eukprot:270500-Prorocentrum_minimum.AAC.7
MEAVQAESRHARAAGSESRSSQSHRPDHHPDQGGLRDGQREGQRPPRRHDDEVVGGDRGGGVAVHTDGEARVARAQSGRARLLDEAPAMAAQPAQPPVLAWKNGTAPGVWVGRVGRQDDSGVL